MAAGKSPGRRQKIPLPENLSNQPHIDPEVDGLPGGGAAGAFLPPALPGEPAETSYPAGRRPRHINADDTVLIPWVVKGCLGIGDGQFITHAAILRELYTYFHTRYGFVPIVAGFHRNDSGMTQWGNVRPASLGPAAEDPR